MMSKPTIHPEIVERMAASAKRLSTFLKMGAIKPIVLNEMVLMVQFAEAAFGKEWHEASTKASYYRSRVVCGLCSDCDREMTGYDDMESNKPLCSLHLAKRDQVIAEIAAQLDQQEQDEC